eukprot:SAG31_NODE_863_length_11394_cov_8.226737_7_plen_70_part_00
MKVAVLAHELGSVLMTLLYCDLVADIGHCLPVSLPRRTLASALRRDAAKWLSDEVQNRIEMENSRRIPN